MPREQGVKNVTTNRRANFEYFIEERLEAGIALTGTEIKSIRAGRVNIQDAFVIVDDNDEMWVLGMHISPWANASRENHDPTRPRKLLLHRRQIDDWATSVQRKGYTIIPLNIHLKDGRAKVDIGLGKGKKLYDKRDQMARADDQRRVERELREHQRSRY